MKKHAPVWHFQLYILVVSIVSNKLNFAMLMLGSFLLGVIMTSLICCRKNSRSRRKIVEKSSRDIESFKSRCDTGCSKGPMSPQHIPYPYYHQPPPMYQSPMIVENPYFERSYSTPINPMSDRRMVKILFIYALFRFF